MNSGPNVAPTIQPSHHRKIVRYFQRKIYAFPGERQRNVLIIITLYASLVSKEGAAFSARKHLVSHCVGKRADTNYEARSHVLPTEASREIPTADVISTCWKYRVVSRAAERAAFLGPTRISTSRRASSPQDLGDVAFT